MNDTEVLRLCLLRIVGPARKMRDELLSSATDNHNVHNVIREYQAAEEHALERMKELKSHSPREADAETDT